ncbi:HNH endonuclease [Methanolobus sp. WCC4]|uniref:HNH endonuclease n=1 Tax=Methanolobus sp. WCC4 TaxID=3125784 RepID=UPI0030F84484
MKSSEYLDVLSVYSRNDLKDLFQITDATINTGIFQPKGHSSVWIFVTKNKTPDRTAYSDDFDGQILNFEGQLKGRTDHKIINHLDNDAELIVFYREHIKEYPESAFKHLGRFQYISHSGDKPTHFVLQALDLGLSDSGDFETLKEPSEGHVAEKYAEGKERTRIQTYFERNPKLRVEALKYHGTKCVACGFDFQERYGQHGSGFIEIHHLFPLSSYTGEEKVDPKTDLVPLCSNCHRMVHRKKEMLTMDELKRILL